MPNKVWFTSDLHFCHLNALYHKPARRMAAGITLDELHGDKNLVEKKYNNWLINLWNETVAKNDTVYILGDLCLGNRIETEAILNKLHGKKYLIRGNHDKSCNGLERYFVWVGDIKEAKFTNNQYKFIDENETFCVEMCHFPMMAWNRRPHGTIHLYGHVHGSLDALEETSGELRLDVGLDGKMANYNLIDLETIYSHFKNKIAEDGCNNFQEYVEKLMLKQGYRI